MRAASIVAALIKESPYLARMSFDLLYMYLTLGSRVKYMYKRSNNIRARYGDSLITAATIDAALTFVASSIRESGKDYSSSSSSSFSFVSSDVLCGCSPLPPCLSMSPMLENVRI